MLFGLPKKFVFLFFKKATMLSSSWRVLLQTLIKEPKHSEEGPSPMKVSFVSNEGSHILSNSTTMKSDAGSTSFLSSVLQKLNAYKSIYSYSDLDANVA